jgi:LysM repeat protein
MWAQYWVCVGVPGVKTTAATPTPTPTGPQPQMPGIVSNCNKYYMVRSGDSCYTIELAQGVTLAQLLSWNTQVNSLCTNLWLSYYICIGVS